MKVAIVHDYLNQLGGAERVVGELHALFPEAPIYTTILDRNKLWPSLQDADIRTSWMQSLPGLRKHFKKYLPFFPRAVESFDLSGYDLVISSSSAFAKAAIKRPEAYHVCYCYTPMRFAWDYDRYVRREQFGGLTRALLPPLIRRLKDWDLSTADRPDRYVVPSTPVAERIRRFYSRDCDVIPPPVDLDRFFVSPQDEDYYLVVSRLTPYKRFDLVIEAFNALRLPLVVIGDGPDRTVLERIARSNIRFLGRMPEEEVALYYARCRGLLIPAEEDFGIIALEANAAGRPVIAYQAGGVLDTIVDGQTGVFFRNQTVAGLKAAVRRCETLSWEKRALRRNAERFSSSVFRSKFAELLQQVLPFPFHQPPSVLPADILPVTGDPYGRARQA